MMRETLFEALLADSPHSHMLVLPESHAEGSDPLTAAWKAARDDAISAYEAWRDGTGLESFTVYRAAADREEAAAAVLAVRAGARRSRWYRLLTRDTR
jgi:hypothetical protein